jgi:hypothetical protein
MVIAGDKKVVGVFVLRFSLRLPVFNIKIR